MLGINYPSPFPCQDPGYFQKMCFYVRPETNRALKVFVTGFGLT